MNIHNTEKDIKESHDKIKELPFCEITETAEHSRLWDENDPCDPGITGRV